MAASNADLLITIKGDQRQMQATLAALNKQVQDLQRQLSSAGAKGADALGKLSNRSKDAIGTFRHLGQQIKEAFVESVIENWTNALLSGIRQAVSALGGLIMQASGLEEAGTKIQALFGDQAAGLKSWADENAAALQLTTLEAQDMASEIGALAKGLGLTNEEAVRMGKSVLLMSADMGSFHNALTSDAVRAWGSALAGETEAMKKFAVIANDMTLKSWLLKQGIDADLTSMDAATKAMYRFNYIAENIGLQGVIGDLKETSNSFANTSKFIGAAWRQMMLDIGVSAKDAARPFLVVLGTQVMPKLKEWGDRFRAWIEAVDWEMWAQRAAGAFQFVARTAEILITGLQMLTRFLSEHTLAIGLAVAAWLTFTIALKAASIAMTIAALITTATGAITAFTAAIAGGATLIGGLVAAVGSLGVVVTPIGIIVAAVAAVIVVLGLAMAGAAVYFYTHTEQIAAAVENMSTRVSIAVGLIIASFAVLTVGIWAPVLAFKQIVDNWATIQQAWQGLVDGAIGMWDGLVQAARDFATGVGEAIDGVRGWFDDLISGIEDAATEAQKQFDSWGDAAAQWVEDHKLAIGVLIVAILTMTAPLWVPFRAWQAMIKAWNENSDEMAANQSKASAENAATWKRWGDNIREIIGGVTGWISRAMATFRTNWAIAWTAITVVAQTAAAFVYAWVGQKVSELFDALSAIGRWFYGIWVYLWTELVNKPVEAIRWLYTTGISLFFGIYQAIVNVLNALGVAADTGVSEFVNIFARAWTWVSEKASSFFGGFFDGAVEFFAKLIEVAGDAWQMIVGFFRDAFGAIDSLLEQFLPMAGSLFDMVGSSWDSGADKAASKIRGWVGKVVGFFSGLPGAIGSYVSKGVTAVKSLLPDLGGLLGRGDAVQGFSPTGGLGGEGDGGSEKAKKAAKKATEKAGKDAADGVKEGREKLIADIAKAMSEAWVSAIRAIREVVGANLPELAQIMGPLDRLRDIMIEGGKRLQQIATAWGDTGQELIEGVTPVLQGVSDTLVGMVELSGKLAAARPPKADVLTGWLPFLDEMRKVGLSFQPITDTQAEDMSRFAGAMQEVAGLLVLVQDLKLDKVSRYVADVLETMRLNIRDAWLTVANVSGVFRALGVIAQEELVGGLDMFRQGSESVAGTLGGFLALKLARTSRYMAEDLDNLRLNVRDAWLAVANVSQVFRQLAPEVQDDIVGSLGRFQAGAVAASEILKATLALGLDKVSRYTADGLDTLRLNARDMWLSVANVSAVFRQLGVETQDEIVGGLTRFRDGLVAVADILGAAGGLTAPTTNPLAAWTIEMLDGMLTSARDMVQRASTLIDLLKLDVSPLLAELRDGLGVVSELLTGALELVSPPADWRKASVFSWAEEALINVIAGSERLVRLASKAADYLGVVVSDKLAVLADGIGTVSEMLGDALDFPQAPIDWRKAAVFSWTEEALINIVARTRNLVERVAAVVDYLGVVVSPKLEDLANAFDTTLGLIQGALDLPPPGDVMGVLDAWLDRLRPEELVGRLAALTSRLSEAALLLSVDTSPAVLRLSAAVKEAVGLLKEAVGAPALGNALANLTAWLEGARPEALVELSGRLATRIADAARSWQVEIPPSLAALTAGIAGAGALVKATVDLLPPAGDTFTALNRWLEGWDIENLVSLSGLVVSRLAAAARSWNVEIPESLGELRDGLGLVGSITKAISEMATVVDWTGILNRWLAGWDIENLVSLSGLVVSRLVKAAESWNLEITPGLQSLAAGVKLAADMIKSVLDVPLPPGRFTIADWTQAHMDRIGAWAQMLIVELARIEQAVGKDAVAAAGSASTAIKAGVDALGSLFGPLNALLESPFVSLSRRQGSSTQFKDRVKLGIVDAFTTLMDGLKQVVVPEGLATQIATLAAALQPGLALLQQIGGISGNIRRQAADIVAALGTLGGASIQGGLRLSFGDLAVDASSVTLLNPTFNVRVTAEIHTTPEIKIGDITIEKLATIIDKKLAEKATAGID